MVYLNFINPTYIRIFLILVFFPVILLAENIETAPLLNEKKIIDDNINQDKVLENDTKIKEDIIKTSPEDDFFSFLDTPYNYISSGVEAAARNIDEFFSDDKIFYSSSGTYLRIQLDTIINEAGDVGYVGDLKLKLRLPNTKKKLRFTLESDANNRPDEISSQPENTPIAVIEEKNYFAGLQATLGRKHEWQFKPSIGLRLGSKVEPYFRFRARRKYDFKTWNIKWHETPYWFDSFGWGLDSSLEFNKIINDDNLFRASTFSRWTNESDQFELSQTFSMYHTLSKRRVVSYFVGVYGVSEPTVYATHYLVGLTYRQIIHKNYLFAEVVPQIRYAKLNDFESEYSILFRIEIVFKK